MGKIEGEDHVGSWKDERKEISDGRVKIKDHLRGKI